MAAEAGLAAAQAVLVEFVNVRGDFMEPLPLAAMVARLAAALGGELRGDWDDGFIEAHQRRALAAVPPNRTAPMTLVEFLLARITEDEVIARAASYGAWTFAEDFEYPGLGNIMAIDAAGNQQQVAYDHDREEGIGACDTEDATHICRWQPSRVLAECEAKRKIVAALGPPHFLAGGSSAPYNAVLRLLAAPYSDHADFDPVWRVQ